MATLTGPAGPLLIGISVYREPADRNAVLFQVGLQDGTAARTSHPLGPTPPYHPPANLAELVSACADAGLITSLGRGVFVAREVAGELHRLLAGAGRQAVLADAHRRAAQYWQWRAAAWPQGRHADVHDLLEARQHLLDAGETDAASELTEVIYAQLCAWGELCPATELVQATLDAMPRVSASRAAWLAELGALAQAGGDHVTAEGRYLQAVTMAARVRDTSGVADGHERLGALAQALGDYRKADRHYREAAAARQDQLRAAARPDHADPSPESPPPSPGPASAPPSPDRSARPARRPPARPGLARRRGRFGRPAVLTALALAVVVPTGAPLVVARASGRSAVLASPQPPARARTRTAVSSGEPGHHRTSPQLLRDSHLDLSPAARRALAAGQVDSRILTVMAAMAATRTLQVIDFGDDGPGAEETTPWPGAAPEPPWPGQAPVAPWPTPAGPFRAADIAVAGPGASAGALRALTSFLRAEHPPYVPASITLRHLSAGQAVLRVDFGAPSPPWPLTATR